jgi:anti-sigma B factor antagonist
VFRTSAVSGRPTADAVTVVVEGEVDLGEAGEFRDAILACLDPTSDLVVLDLTDVAYFGSAGIRDLLQARDRLDRQGVALCVDDASDIVERVLTLTNIRDYFPRSEVVLDLRDHPLEPPP